MPKVRDLGISFIPATMRPLEYGDGAVEACAASVGCDLSGCDKGASCIEPSSARDMVEPCVPLSGICDKQTHCDEPSAYEDDKDDKNDDKNDDKKKREGHLNASAIAQLRQQMQQQLGM